MEKNYKKMEKNYKKMEKNYKKMENNYKKWRCQIKKAQWHGKQWYVAKKAQWNKWYVAKKAFYKKWFVLIFLPKTKKEKRELWFMFFFLIYEFCLLYYTFFC
jgi:hypothetical protein